MVRQMYSEDHEKDLMPLEGDSKIPLLTSFSPLVSDASFRLHTDLDVASEQTGSTHTHTNLDVVSEEVASVFILQLLSLQKWQDKVFRHLQGTVLSHTRDTYKHRFIIEESSITEHWRSSI